MKTNTVWLVVVLGLGCGNAKDAPDEKPSAEIRIKAAEQSAAQAQRDAKAAQDQVAALEQKSTDMKAAITSAINAVESAQNESERAAARAKLAELQNLQAAMQQQVGDAKAAAAKAERSKGVLISRECLDNPLAKGCN